MSEFLKSLGALLLGDLVTVVGCLLLVVLLLLWVQLLKQGGRE
jgi:hypothetical protein